MAGKGYSPNKIKIAGTWADGDNVANISLAPSGPPLAALNSPGGQVPSSATYQAWSAAMASDEVLSWRPGGARVSMCDGSTQSIDRGIDPSVLRSLSSRNGGEQIPGRVGELIRVPRAAPSLLSDPRSGILLGRCRQRGDSAPLASCP